MYSHTVLERSKSVAISFHFNLILFFNLTVFKRRNIKHWAHFMQNSIQISVPLGSRVLHDYLQSTYIIKEGTCKNCFAKVPHCYVSTLDTRFLSHKAHISKLLHRTNPKKIKRKCVHASKNLWHLITLYYVVDTKALVFKCWTDMASWLSSPCTGVPLLPLLFSAELL